MLMAVACTALLMVPVLIFAPQLVEFFNKKREIVDYGSMLLRLIFALFMFSAASIRFLRVRFAERATAEHRCS